MKASVLVVALLALGGCVSGPAKPASVGMSVDEYRLACPLDGMLISQSADWVIGECRDKPNEYVEFRAGRVAAVMDEVQMFDRLAEFKCVNVPDAESCRHLVLQQAAEHVSKKASDGRNARNAELNDFLSRIGPGDAPDIGTPASTPRAAAPSSGFSCQLSGEESAGMNRICFYDCMGSMKTIARNVSVGSFCPNSTRLP